MRTLFERVDGRRAARLSALSLALLVFLVLLGELALPRGAVVLEVAELVVEPVSYTHLDVYKRQLLDWPGDLQARR